MADKLISELTAVSSVAAGDEIAIQKTGEEVAKKATITQITQIEATARELWDNAIKASVGLTAGAAFPTMTNSWYLRAADFTAGLTDRTGLHASVVANIYNALRMLDARLYANSYSMGQNIRTASINCSAADILTCHTLPKTILINAERGSVLEIISIVGIYEYGSSPFEVGENKLIIRYIDEGSLESIGPIFEFPTTFIESTTNIVNKALPTSEPKMIVDAGLELYCATSPTGGNGNITISILYRVHGITF